MHPAAQHPDELLADCQIQRTRGSGPGGQHRNKVETAIRLTHRPTGVSVLASERRSQEANRQAAVLRLRVKLALAVRRPIAADGRPSVCWQGRVRGGRLAINPGHVDFPALLAEALDRIESCAADVAAAADELSISTSQLVKLLKHEPAALEQVNHARREAGLRTLG